MSKARAALLAFCCGPLLGRSMQVESETEKGCNCLSWHDAYTPKYGADCNGMGDPYICQRFLMKLPKENFCMNSAFGNTTQWCYVPAHCKYGKKLQWAAEGADTKKVLWKKCEGKRHHYLKNSKIMELSAWSRENNIDVGVAAQFAYPTWQEEHLYQVAPFWNVPAFPGTQSAPVNETLKPRLQQLVRSKQTMFFASPTQRSPFGVAEGNEFYWINLAMPFINLVLNHQEDSMRPGEVNDVKCVAGCNKTVNPWWSKLNQIQ